MIGARLTPHHTHSLAVLVRVVAATVFIAAAVLIPVSIVGVALHHLAAGTALVRIVVALALSLIALAAARWLDPLRR